MKWPGSIVAAALVVGMAGPSSAGQIQLAIRAGLVSLDAKDATLREILAEWARVGQTRIVNAENMAGGLVTLQLTDVPERQALETLLRSTAGFIAAPRPVPQESLSTYDRIVLMPGVRPAVVPTAGSSAPSGQLPGVRDRVASTPVIVSDDDDQADENPVTSTPSLMGAQRPGMPSANPYAPAVGGPSATTSPSAPGTLPQSSERPGLPTAPAPPIK
jgi:hypothetical protein